MKKNGRDMSKVFRKITLVRSLGIGNPIKRKLEVEKIIQKNKNQ